MPRDTWLIRDLGRPRDLSLIRTLSVWSARRVAEHQAEWCVVARVGSERTRLIIIRGNSGTGKSTLAAAIRAARPRGVAIVGHDQLRREILHVRDYPGTPAAGYVDLSARYALDCGLHTVVEGILHDEIYGDLLRQLIDDHLGISRCYRYDVTFEETLRRHATKPRQPSSAKQKCASGGGMPIV